MKKLFKLATVTAALAFGAAAHTQAADTIGFADPQFLIQNHPLLLEASEKYAKFVKENEAKFAEEDKALAAENKKISDEDKTLSAAQKKLENDAKSLKNEQNSIEAASKKKMAELDKNTRLSTKQKQAEFDKALGKRIKAFENKVSAIQKQEADFVKKAEAFQKKAEAFQKKVAAFQEKVNKANQEAGGIDPVAAQQKAIEEINTTIRKVAKEKGYTLIFHPSTALYAEDESKDITEAVLLAMGGKMPEAPKPAEQQPAENNAPAQPEAKK